MMTETYNDRPDATGELSDEALATMSERVNYTIRYPDGHYKVSVRREYVGKADGATAEQAETIAKGRIARALRAALCPAVTPLSAGEKVTVEDMYRDARDAHDPPDAGIMTLAMSASDALSVKLVDSELGESGLRRIFAQMFLDAAGVRLLRDTCNRALAAMEGE